MIVVFPYAHHCHEAIDSLACSFIVGPLLHTPLVILVLEEPLERIGILLNFFHFISVGLSLRLCKDVLLCPHLSY